jgi:hypothetical protein
MMAACYKTKKALKEAKGQKLKYIETSLHGFEYPQGGTGTFAVVGPSPFERKWFAEVTIKNHVITKVT